MSFLFPTFKRTLSFRQNQSHCQLRDMRCPSNMWMAYLFVHSVKHEIDDSGCLCSLCLLGVCGSLAVLLDPDITTVSYCPFLIHWIIGSLGRNWPSCKVWGRDGQGFKKKKSRTWSKNNFLSMNGPSVDGGTKCAFRDWSPLTWERRGGGENTGSAGPWAGQSPGSGSRRKWGWALAGNQGSLTWPRSHCHLYLLPTGL